MTIVQQPATSVVTSPTSPNVFSITGCQRAIDLPCLRETWHDADSAVLGRLRVIAYTTSSIVPTLVKHGCCCG